MYGTYAVVYSESEGKIPHRQTAVFVQAVTGRKVVLN
jgi:hypothetical protein